VEVARLPVAVYVVELLVPVPGAVVTVLSRRPRESYAYLVVTVWLRTNWSCSLLPLES